MNSQRERHVTQRHASIPLDCGQKPFGVENQPPARTFKKEPGNIGKRLVTRGMLHDHAKQGYLLDQGRRSEPVASHIGTECTGPPIPANHSGVAIRREGAGGHHDMVPSEPTCSTDATQETSVEAAHKSDGDIVTTDGGRAGRLRCRGNKLRLSYRQRRGWSFEPGEAERLLVVGRSRRSQAHVRPASRTADKDVDEDDAEDELKGPDTTATLSTPIPGRDGDYGDTGVSKQDSTLTQITVIHDPDRQDDSSLAAADEASTAGSCESAAERGACQIPSASLP